MDKDFKKGFLSGAGVTTGIGITLISFVLIGFLLLNPRKQQLLFLVDFQM